MRRILIACLLLGSSQAVAAPRSWADWIGDFRGTLVWRQCTAPGASAAMVAVDAVDGAMRVDLSALGAALRIYSLQQDAAGWAAQDGDLSVGITQRRPNTIELAITYDSGCTARGRLTRTTTGVTACDRLLAWSRIEARCTKASDKLEAAIANKLKKADAARCTARADKLELLLIDAGCAPHPDPQIGTRAVECRALSDATQKLARCGRVPPEIMQRLSANASGLLSAAQTAERATLPYVERQCKDARTELAGTAVQFQCQL